MKFHIVKRDNCPLWLKCSLYIGAVVLALLLGAIVLAGLGVNPIAYYTRMFTMGTIGNKIAYKVYINYLKDFVPLALTSVALSLAFKMRFWNIGGEGQFILGAISAAFVAFKLGPVLPNAATLLAMCLAAMIVAGLYGLFFLAVLNHGHGLQVVCTVEGAVNRPVVRHTHTLPSRGLGQCAFRELPALVERSLAALSRRADCDAGNS